MILLIISIGAYAITLISFLCGEYKNKISISESIIQSEIDELRQRICGITNETNNSITTEYNPEKNRF